MEAIWHITIDHPDRLTLFPEESARRRAVRTISRLARNLLALFCIVDSHLHLLAAGES
jgi:hypothetical protein